MWFLTVHGERLFFPYEDVRLVREMFTRAIDHQEFGEALNADSLGMVDLVLEFEEALEQAV
ncbi:MAG: hypothetical protein AAGD32_15455 [Planctomycetota bacterium]